MTLFLRFLEVFQHLDNHLDYFILNYGVWTYLILFMVIFCETGLVIAPYFPGDSLLFVAGTLATTGQLDLKWLFIFLSTAAVLGNMFNYWIGSLIGPRVFNKENAKIFNKEHLMQTHLFYYKYGAVAIIISRFIPFARAFAPFVAGIGKMDFRAFFVYNIIGGVGWVIFFTLAGFFFGRLNFVKENSFFIIFVILLLSIIMFPLLIWFIKRKNDARNQTK